MDSAISRLRKVLLLEQKQGCRNKAVIGGLDKFVGRWEADARSEIGQFDAVKEIVALLLGYPAVEDTAARERILEQVLRRATELEDGQTGSRAASAPPGAPAPPAASSTTAVPAPEPATSETVIEPIPGKPASLPPEAANRPAAPEPVTRPSGEPAVSKPTVPAARAVTPPVDPTALPGLTRPDMPVGPKPAPSSLDAPVTRLPHVGISYAQRLARLGVRTVRDLLYLLPHRYEDFSRLRTIDQLHWGEVVTVIGTAWEVRSRTLGADRRIVTAVIGDGTGQMSMTWFNPYIERQLRPGFAYAFSGKVETYRDQLTMRNPNFEALDRSQVSTARLVPVYPLTEGISAAWLRRMMQNAVESCAGEVPDIVPETTRRELELMTTAEALSQVHFPDNRERLAAAQRRLSFDEFFLLQLGVLGVRHRFRSVTARPLQSDRAALAEFVSALPFALTSAQRRALEQIAGDMAGSRPMARLLQGDVGSGKTAVAAAALWLAVTDGAQGAIMAPTEILAEQHFRSLTRMFDGLVAPKAQRPVRVVLLAGGQPGAEREEALQLLAAGDADIAVGTHALIQQAVAFRELGLAVVDEQHRFGVEQRSALRSKGGQPHLLVMSATPIPRSLALTIYGDLDVSVIDELPAGRTAIKTKWLASSQRERAYDFIRRQVASGRQGFIVYPRVEESPDSDAKAAVEEHTRLQQLIFPDLRLGLLHGRLRGIEKDAVMTAFARGELDLLVATSVVEVGIDVPNASVMLVEGAERFGLAQLHQFRGRVGRGPHPSYCVLISDAAEGQGSQRLQALETTNDGFALAQIDLELRGPGDFFGTRQSGLPPLQTAQLSDLRTLEQARSAAEHLFEADPNLEHPEHRLLAAQVAAFWRGAGDVS